MPWQKTGKGKNLNIVGGGNRKKNPEKYTPLSNSLTVLNTTNRSRTKLNENSNAI